MTLSPSSSSKHIMWVTGWPNCGKTTVGDYLAQYASYAHIDVDDDFMLARFKDGKPDPDDVILGSYIKSWNDFYAEKAPSSEDFGPMLELVCDRIIALQKKQIDGGAVYPKIVITQGMHREGRNFVRERVSNIFFIGLAASLEKKIERARIKQDKFIPKLTGKQQAEWFEERTGMKFTVENFDKDWREANKARLPVMDKMDIDPDEEESNLGCNVLVHDLGDAGVLPKVRDICGINHVGETEDLNSVFETSWAKMDKHFKGDIQSK